ncbi:hypothetical protein Q4Q35_05655 [Flavivirga aquimarina]|uniref:Thioredoxin domain-containing protein n=1 Tax=Flavivirga aquimarina TaxID=2027862 RepID=A0ABT8W830_9FLAO|nr:hypothetical protein [Flavivirga aquimarina]MDO5969287.1 hypothetical protein [Flavivirga aquimarina]
MNYLLKILGIVLSFTLIGYALTYPYELSYTGEDGVILIEDPKEFTSIEQVIHRPEFKNKVLYVRIGEPLEAEILRPNYNDNKANKIIVRDNGEKQIIHSKSQPYYFQLQRLSELKEHYSNQEVVLVFIDFPDSDTNTQEDDIRKWKAIIKKYKVKGCHVMMNSKAYLKMRHDIEKEKGIPSYLHYNLLVSKNGKIVNDNAPSPSFNKEKLYREIDSLLAL